MKLYIFWVITNRSKPTSYSKPDPQGCVVNLLTPQNRPDPTKSIGFDKFLKVSGLGWVMKLFFHSVSSWVWVISQICLTHLDPPIFNIYLKLKKKYITQFCYLLFCPSY